MEAKRLVLSYIRVSTDRQAESGLGLEAQRQRIADYCKFKELRIERSFEDQGISASIPLGERPAGQRMIAEIKRRPAIIIAVKLDRFFRSVADAANSITDFGKRNIELVCIAEGFDMSTYMGRAMTQMAAVFSEMERAATGERTRAALNVLRNRHMRISRHTPYGRNLEDNGHLSRNADEGEVIKRMATMRREGLTYRAIADELNAGGIPPKRGTHWIHTSVRSILLRSV